MSLVIRNLDISQILKLKYETSGGWDSKLNMDSIDVHVSLILIA